VAFTQRRFKGERNSTHDKVSESKAACAKAGTNDRCQLFFQQNVKQIAVAIASFIGFLIPPLSALILAKARTRVSAAPQTCVFGVRDNERLSEEALAKRDVLSLPAKISFADKAHLLADQFLN